MEDYEQPIQTMHNLKNKEVTVELRSGESVSGKLIAFDLYTNVTLETEIGTRFIQGGSVCFVYEKKGAEVIKEDTKPTIESEAGQETQSESEIGQETKSEPEDRPETQSPEDTSA